MLPKEVESWKDMKNQNKRLMEIRYIYIFRYASVNIGPIKTIYIYKNNMYAPAGN